MIALDEIDTVQYNAISKDDKLLQQYKECG